MGLLVLALVPIVLAVSVKVPSRSARGGPDFLASITANGLFVALAALTVEMGLFLPLAIAMLSGDAIAGEANLGTLRYLLTVPVSRTRLLLVKYASLCIGALWGVPTVAVAGGIAGVALFGTGPLTTLSGSQLDFPAAARPARARRALPQRRHRRARRGGAVHLHAHRAAHRGHHRADDLHDPVVDPRRRSAAGLAAPVAASSTSGSPSPTCCATRRSGTPCCRASRSTSRMPWCSGCWPGPGSPARTSPADPTGPVSWASRCCSSCRAGRARAPRPAWPASSTAATRGPGRRSGPASTSRRTACSSRP